MQRLIVAMGFLTTVAAPGVALACGCFTPPDPTVPILQAGERLVFAADNGNITAHIQIQYQGAAAQFGWLLPLPSVPTLELGTDELFTRIAAATQPTYRMTQNISFCNGGNQGGYVPTVGCGAQATSVNATTSGDGGASTMPPVGDPRTVVIQDAIGPYEYAVLKADDKQEMLDWLAANRFFVPTGLDNAVDPYIHPGAYFLALKLRGGKSAGDIQPVVVRYASDLPMIPIVLTQVGAVPDMGVQVWLLGKARAIPRNYHHTILNDMSLWLGTPYETLVTRAVKEAPKRHSFVTEYAGPSTVAQGLLDPTGRFGDLTTLRGITGAIAYCKYLNDNGYPFSPTLLTILQRHLEIPSDFANVKPATYYANLDVYVDSWQAQHAADDGGAATLDLEFDPAALTDEIEQRIVTPTRDAGALLRKFPYLTRLYTTLSPADMTDDPVFSFNPDLPEVPLEHKAVYTRNCNAAPYITDQNGLESNYVVGAGAPTLMASSVRVEILREAGQPMVVTNNQVEIQTVLGPVDHSKDTKTLSEPVRAGGCTTGDGAPRGELVTFGTFLLTLLGLALLRRRHRSN